MAISVVMPALEMAQETGKLVAWRKREGEPVVKGETLLEVETDKAVMEIEAPGDGVLAGVKVQEGAVVPVGQTIAWIVSPGELPPDVVQPAASRVPASRPAPSARETHTPFQPAAPVGAISPKARRLAQEHGIDLKAVRGSGPEGAVVAEDILALVAERGAAPPGQVEGLSSVGRLMAERTTQAWTTVPHFFVVREADAGALAEARQQLASGSPEIRVTHTDILAALVAHVLVKHPKLNSSWTGSGIRPNPEINIALAISVKDGVVAGVIHNADRATLGDIATQRRELSERAKAGRLRPADISGGTFTLSNLGMFNVDAFSAIITPPQAAILAVGRIADRVVAVNGRPAVRPMIKMTLSCDHRVVDGAQAAAFLNDLAEAVRDPLALLD